MKQEKPSSSRSGNRTRGEDVVIKRSQNVKCKGVESEEDTHFYILHFAFYILTLIAFILSRISPCSNPLP